MSSHCAHSASRHQSTSGPPWATSTPSPPQIRSEPGPPRARSLPGPPRRSSLRPSPRNRSCPALPLKVIAAAPADQDVWTPPPIDVVGQPLAENPVPAWPAVELVEVRAAVEPVLARSPERQVREVRIIVKRLSSVNRVVARGLPQRSTRPGTPSRSVPSSDRSRGRHECWRGRTASRPRRVRKCIGRPTARRSRLAHIVPTTREMAPWVRARSHNRRLLAEKRSARGRPGRRRHRGRRQAGRTLPKHRQRGPARLEEIAHLLTSRRTGTPEDRPPGPRLAS